MMKSYLLTLALVYLALGQLFDLNTMLVDFYTIVEDLIQSPFQCLFFFTPINLGKVVPGSPKWPQPAPNSSPSSSPSSIPSSSPSSDSDPHPMDKVSFGLLFLSLFVNCQILVILESKYHLVDNPADILPEYFEDIELSDILGYDAFANGDHFPHRRIKLVDFTDEDVRLRGQIHVAHTALLFTFDAQQGEVVSDELLQRKLAFFRQMAGDYFLPML